MDMENKELEPGGEELDNIVSLTDEEGNEVLFELLDYVEYGGCEYVVLYPVESDDGEVLILQVVPLDDEMEEYRAVDDEGVLQSVFEVFREQSKDIIEFAE